MTSITWPIAPVIAIALASIACTNPAPVYRTTGSVTKASSTGGADSPTGGKAKTASAKSKAAGSTAASDPSGGDDDTGDVTGDVTGDATGNGSTPKKPGTSPQACIAAASSPGSGRHHPGESCGSCHDSMGDLAWTVAGTLFDVNGAEGVAGATIEFVDATGKKFRLQTADNGNFYTTDAVTMPLTVRASQCPSSSAMNAKVNTNSCNSCHDASNPIHL